MKTTTLGILIGVILFLIVLLIVFKAEGPSRIDLSNDQATTDTISTTSESAAPPAQMENDTESTSGTQEIAPVDVPPAAPPPPVVTPPVVTPPAIVPPPPPPPPSEEEQATTTGTQPETSMPEETATGTEEIVEETPPPPPPPLGDLVLHLTFDDGAGNVATDQSGYGNNGGLVDMNEMTAWTADGKFGGALSFDGVNDVVLINNSDSLNIGDIGEDYTVSFWFKSGGNPGGEREVIAKGGRSGTSPFALRIDNDGDASFRVSDGANASTQRPSVRVTTGAWKHIVMVRNTATDRIYLYIDGTERGGIVTDETKSSMENELPIHIGRYETGPNTFAYYAFSIDDLRIYKRALGPGEISTLFAGGDI